MANTKPKTINCCTPQQKGNAHHIYKWRGIPNHPHQSSEGPASSPGDKSVQDSEQLQLNTIKAESTEECQLCDRTLNDSFPAVSEGFCAQLSSFRSYMLYVNLIRNSC